MNLPVTSSGARLAVSAATLLVVSGCATVNLEQQLEWANAETIGFTEGRLALARSDEEREARLRASESLLASPLGRQDAVRLALLNSPSLQALIAQGWADSALAAQSGRISNPIFSFERIVAGDELELGRLISFGLLDLITLPQRKGIADQRIEQARLRLASDVVDRVTQVRQGWIRAVAAQQRLAYARQVYESAEVSAELARRMESVGNFNRIARARQQSFYADAATRLATARQQSVSAREELVRLLGLDDAQARKLRLPDRLPDLPKQPLQPQEVARTASDGRLDIRLGQAALEASARAQGLVAITSFTDIELGVRRDTTFDNASGTRSSPRGYEIDVRLPVFDWGGMQRDAMTAQTLAAASRLEATTRAAGSHLRESYAAYRTAYDVARHHRDEVVPLRRTIAEENQLRYNAMLIGVFELLADARDQVSTVIAAIDAQQQFWLADAGLQASLVGRPTSTAIPGPPPASAAAVDPH